MAICKFVIFGFVGSSGAWSPPTPSTSRRSDVACIFSMLRMMGVMSMSWFKSFAAMAGASGFSKRMGFIVASGCGQFAKCAMATASSETSCPRSLWQPEAKGFRTPTDFFAVLSAFAIAQVTRVLPMSVSVPRIRRPGIFGVGRFWNIISFL